MRVCAFAVPALGALRRQREQWVELRAIIAYNRENNRLEVKPAWEIKSFDEYTLDMVGYRFKPGVTTVRKVIFLHTKRLAKRIYKVKEKRGIIVPHNAQAIVSQLGWFSHSDDKYFLETYINPYIDEKEILEVISNESKKHSLARLPCGA